MDKIHFSVRKVWKGITVEIEINGRSFIEMLKEVEKPYDRVRAGAYKGIVPWQSFDPVSYFLAEDEVQLMGDGKLEVLVCRSCGTTGCWPMLVRISANPESVIWSDFEQPHREWWYDRLGSFLFDRNEYVSDLESLKADLIIVKNR